MARLPEAMSGGTSYFNIMNHRPEIARHWGAMDEFLRFTGTLDPDLKEEVRRVLAQAAGCAFCASLGDPKDHYDDPRTAAAVAFARAVAGDPVDIADDAFAAAAAHFSVPEMVELCAWISFMVGAELFGAMMKLEPATDETRRTYARWLERGRKKHWSPEAVRSMP